MTTTESTNNSVTVLGLGAMGSALAQALVASGRRTTVWNRTPEKADAIVAAGAVRAATVADAVTASPLTIACVVDDEALHEVLEATGSALSGRAFVNLTNGTPEQARDAAARATELGATGVVDGGIMATPPMIGQPYALVLYSGAADAFEAHRSTLEVLGTARFLGDDPGLASLYDLALLSGMYGLFGGAFHAFALVGSAGVPARGFVEMLLPWLEAMASSLPRLAEQIDTDDHATDSPLAMQVAALANIAATSAAQGVDAAPILAVQRLVDEAVAAGHGDDGLSRLPALLGRPAATTG